MNTETPTIAMPTWLPEATCQVIEQANIALQPVQQLMQVATPHALSERVEWRIARLYRDICYLFSLPDSQQRGYVFAESDWYTKKYDCDAATVRRWQAHLIKAGWLVSVGRGPQRRLIPVVHPGQIVQFLPRFARLFSGVLRGFWRRLTFNTLEKGMNSNSTTSAKQTSTELSGEERVVVASLRSQGIGTEKQAIALVRQHGIERCLEQLDALPYRNAKNPGAVLSESIRDNWPPPNGLIAAREEARQKEVRQVEEAARVERARQERERQRAEDAARHAREQAVRAADMAQARQVVGEALWSAWETTRATLKGRLGPIATNLHLPHLKPVGRDGDVVILAAPPVSRVWLEKRHSEDIRAALGAALGEAITLRWDDAPERKAQAREIA